MSPSAMKLDFILAQMRIVETQEFGQLECLVCFMKIPCTVGKFECVSSGLFVDHERIVCQDIIAQFILFLEIYAVAGLQQDVKA